jgi:hypothetical protein
MGLTIEEVNEMQDEMNKIGDSTADDAKAADETAKLAEAKAAEDKAKADADTIAAEKAAKEKEQEGSKTEEEVDLVRELKEQVRASADALKKVTSDYQKLQKIMVDKGLITDEETKLSEAEETAAKAAWTARQEKLTEMVAIMEVNPTYADVRQVCSQSNLDDVVEAFARFYVKENGGQLEDVITTMEKEIWSEPNPYKKIYTLVKQYHPKYVTKEDKKVEDDKSKTDEAAAAAKKIAEEADKKKVAADANPSAANIGAGGSGAGSGGWTSAKIDALEEDELKTVPKDIYDKYLKGTLS